MKPGVVDTPARRAAALECRMHHLMDDLVSEGRLEDAQRCRDRLLAQSTLRHCLATVELELTGKIP